MEKSKSGIEPSTFRFVAQYLNHCATAAASWKNVVHWNIPEWVMFDNSILWLLTKVAVFWSKEFDLRVVVRAGIKESRKQDWTRSHSVVIIPELRLTVWNLITFWGDTVTGTSLCRPRIRSSPYYVVLKLIMSFATCLVYLTTRSHIQKTSNLHSLPWNHQVLQMVWCIPQLKSGTRSVLCNRSALTQVFQITPFNPQLCLTPGEQVTKNCLKFFSRNFRYWVSWLSFIFRPLFVDGFVFIGSYTCPKIIAMWCRIG
jgi:hypothetical protein